MLKRKKKIIAKVMATTMLATTLATTFAMPVSALEPKAVVSVDELKGKNREHTAIKISEKGWTSATNAVIINGYEGLVDALTATPYAKAKNAPILITKKDALPSETKTRLTQLGVKNVDIVGGNGVISEAVVNELKAMNITVNRISGKTRYKTAAAVADAMDNISNVTKVAVVNGATGLPDAVSVAVPAAYNNMPILLSDPNKGIEDSKDFLKEQTISKSYVVGGSGAVSDTVMNSLPGSKERLGGKGRQGTNAKVIEEFYTSSSLNNVYVAKSGQVQKEDEVVDALSVGVLAAKENAPVVIVGNGLDTAQKSLLEGKKFTKITKVGGGIPTASIEAIKATQADPEAKVTTVSMVDYKTIKIKGTELNRLNASNVSIAGNSVKSYSANSNGTEATVVFNNAFSNGTNTVTIKSNLGNTTTHTFTYSSQISSVEATTKEVKTSGIQYAEFTVNGGQKRTVEELKALGWTVKFTSKDKIFYSATEASNVSETSTTGKLKTSFNNGDVHAYEVTLTKGKETVKSGLQAFEAKSGVNDYKEIKSYDLALESGVKTNSNTLVVGEKGTIENVKALDKSNNEALLSSGLTFKSSNPEVVSINASSGAFVAHQTGRSTITIKSGDLTKTVTLTVKADARKASSTVLSSNRVNLVKKDSVDTDSDIIITVKDQYGDPFVGKTFTVSEDINMVSGSGSSQTTTKIATATFEKVGSGETLKTNTEGKIKVNISADAKGSANLLIKEDTKTIGTISVSVSDDATVKSYGLQVPAGLDTTLDVYQKADTTADNTLTLKLNKYNGSSYLVGTEKAIKVYKEGTTPTTGIWIKSSDEKIVSLPDTTKDGNITLTAKKAGTATIQVFDGANTRAIASISITVRDTTPTISSISLDNIDIINKEGTTSFDVESLFNTTIMNTNIMENKTVASGVALTGTSEEVLLGDDGTRQVLFVDRGTKNGTYSSSEDLLLGTIDVSTDFGVTAENKSKTVALTKGNKGNIIVKIYKGEYNPSTNPFIVKTIKVDL